MDGSSKNDKHTLRGCSSCFCYLAVNKLITDKTQISFSFIAEHFGFIEQ